MFTNDLRKPIRYLLSIQFHPYHHITLHPKWHSPLLSHRCYNRTMNIPWLHKHIVLLTLAFALTVSATAEPQTLRDNWHAVLFQDQHAGWMHETSTQQDHLITTTVNMHIGIKRGPITLTIDTESQHIEHTDGSPVSITSTQKFAGQSMTKTVEFSNDGDTFTTTIGAQTQSTALPNLGRDWLMPATAAGYVQQQMDQGATTITYKTFDPSVSIEAFTVTHTTLGEQNIELYGRIAPAIKRTTAMSVMQGIDTEEYISKNGELLKMTLNFGAISMTTLAADQQLAQAEIEAPEIMAATLVQSKTAIPNPRYLRQAKLRLTATSGDLPDLPNTAIQSVKRVNDQHAILTINLDQPTAPSQDPPTLTNAPMIDGRDPHIIALLKDNNLHTLTPPAKQAEAIRNFVHNYITSADLSVGMASASEVAQTQQGDCTEFAVLFAAMLRAAQIPSRVATGLIYVDRFLGQKNVFGYHMWTQAYLDGRWVNLDATLPEDQPFDATHILLATSNLDEEMHNDIIIIAKIIGQLDIQYTP